MQYEKWMSKCSNLIFPSGRWISIRNYSIPFGIEGFPPTNTSVVNVYYAGQHWKYYHDVKSGDLDEIIDDILCEEYDL